MNEIDLKLKEVPMTITRNTMLTPNFRLGEFLYKDSPMPADWVIANLYRLANRLQVIRDVIGKPMVITSGWRSAEHNKAVGGAPNSMHLNGMAADIVVPGMPAREVQALLKNWSGGMGRYQHFTHLDIRPVKAHW